MDVEDGVVLFISLWILTSALAVKSVDVFITLTLIGLLVTLEVGGLFLSREKKEEIKPIVELLIFMFALIVLKKVYEVLSG
ncbi:hypothetical protein APY94_02065 [Thermococcus celericrescens]|uniref:Uncharacterized protein n=1 Tax=Thermococcus celericrescens TaxID=227598 RepID=A0A100XZD3_9EURY|nr:hypothetical protein [Thermococcus celericrescens]KUH34441.1 hypothetical protein APY94_02065 [Thermococcus celericrescens]